MVYIALIILGLCLGSFVNALVWRLHEQDLLASKAKAPKKQSKSKSVVLTSQDLSIVKGRSICTHCHHKLSWYDLLPVLSWASLKGKCRYCHKAIGWQYPLVELLTVGIFVFSYAFWPNGLDVSSIQLVLFGFWLVFVTGFMALMVYDLCWMMLPDRIVKPMQVLAAVYVIVAGLVAHDILGALRGAGAGLIFSAGLFYAMYYGSKFVGKKRQEGQWIGYGDVKLAVVLGLVLGGGFEALLMLFIASVLGTIVGVPALLGKKAKLTSKLPFGPFLIIATIIVYLFGASLIAWYKHKLFIN